MSSYYLRAERILHILECRGLSLSFHIMLYFLPLIQETLESRVEEQERRIKHYQEKIEQVLEEKDQIHVN